MFQSVCLLSVFVVTVGAALSRSCSFFSLNLCLTIIIGIIIVIVCLFFTLLLQRERERETFHAAEQLWKCLKKAELQDERRNDST